VQGECLLPGGLEQWFLTFSLNIPYPKGIFLSNPK
jgi:hypothetical protein